MRRIIRFFGKLAWRATAPIRRPLLARFDARIGALIAGTVNARIMPELIGPLAIALRRLERIEETLARADRSASAMAEEVDLVLNGLSREIFRLQAQVESIERFLDDDRRMATAGGLSIVDEAGDEAPIHRANPAERSMVG